MSPNASLSSRIHIAMFPYFWCSASPSSNKVSPSLYEAHGFHNTHTFVHQFDDSILFFKGNIFATGFTDWILLVIFNGSAIILSYNVNKTIYLWDNYSQWNILKHDVMFGTMNTIHREHPVAFSGCFKQTAFLVFWSLQKFLTKICIPSKLSQHNFQLLFRDSIFS